MGGPRTRWALLVLLAAGVQWPAGSAWADPVYRVVGRVAAEEGAADPRPGPIQARVGQTVELSVGVVRARGPRPRVQPLPEGARVRWLRVVPRRFHEETDPPNEGVALFSNSRMFGPDHGRWIGFDTLEYETVPLREKKGLGIDVDADGGGLRLSRALAHPDVGEAPDGAGTVFLAAEVTLPDGTTTRTPDGDDVGRLGLSPAVMRVSFRASDGYLGWLGTYFGIPFVFGSSGPSPSRHQTDRYTGADCADVLVGALRASGRAGGLRYVSVAGIGRYAQAASEPLRLTADGDIEGMDGEPRSLRWGRDVRPGDLVAIEYSGAGDRLPRNWDHIGALAADRGPDGRPDGVLDGADLLRHMGGGGLVDQPLTAQGVIKLRIWRWKKSVWSPG